METVYLGLAFPQSTISKFKGLFGVSAMMYSAISFNVYAAHSVATPIITGSGGPTIPTDISVEATYMPGMPIIGTASGSTDPDGDPITYEYRWCTQENGGGTCSHGAEQTFPDKTNRFFAVRASTTRGYPQLYGEWSPERLVEPLGGAPMASSVIVSGFAKEGYSLTANYIYTDSDDDPAATAEYQWLRNSIIIEGATSSSYQLTGDDVSHNISVTVKPVASYGQPRKGTAVVSPHIRVTSSGDFVSVPGVGTFSHNEVLRSWTNTNLYCENLTDGGYSDWRLPTSSEAYSLYSNYPDGAIGNELSWSLSTFYWIATQESVGHHYIIPLDTGMWGAAGDSNLFYALCIR